MKIKNISIIFIVAYIWTNTLFTVSSQSFTDVNEESKYYNAIEYLSYTGIFKGYEDGTFQPDIGITKAEIAVLITRMLDKENEAKNINGFAPFIDVPPSHWCYGYIYFLYNCDILPASTRFYPDRYADFSDIITLTVNALGYKEEALSYGYTAVAERYGCLENVVVTDESITRAEAAQIIYNTTSKDNTNDTAVIIDNIAYEPIAVRREAKGPLFPIKYDYYIPVSALSRHGFKSYEYAGNTYISRYGKELTITKDIVMVNGAYLLGSYPLKTFDNRKHICLQSLANLYGESYNLDTESNTLTIKLKGQPKLASSKMLKGTIILPDFEKAPYSGLVFKISAYANAPLSEPVSKYVLIDSDENYAEFEMAITNDVSDYSEYTITYELVLGNYSFPRYAQKGFFSYYGSRSVEKYKSLVAIDAETNISITVLKNDCISGTVSGDTTTTDVYIEAFNDDGFITDISTGPGEYRVYYPSDINVYLKCTWHSSKDDVTGYYTQNGATLFEKDKEPVRFTGSHAYDINLEMPQSQVITGCMAFPSENVMQYDYGNIYLIDKDDLAHYFNFNYYRHIESSVSFSFNIPSSANKYVLYIDSRYESGFLGSEYKLTETIDDAIEFQTSAGDNLNINFKLNIPVVSGVISLPEGENPPKGGIAVDIQIGFVEEGLYGDYSIVPYKNRHCEITEGETSIDFCIEYQSGKDICLYYTTKCESYSKGYYVNGQTVSSFTGNPKLTGFENINITLIKNSEIRGTVFLPFPVEDENGAYLRVELGGCYKKLTIPKGAQSAQYILYTSETFETSVAVKAVFCYNSPYAITYHQSRPDMQENVFSLIELENIGTIKNDINFYVRPAYPISGIIKAPISFNPMCTINLKLFDADNNFEKIDCADLSLENFSYQQQFKLYLGDRLCKNVVLAYSIDNCDENIYDYGVYNENKTSLSVQNATVLHLSDENPPVIDFSLLHKNPLIINGVNIFVKPDIEIATSVRSLESDEISALLYASQYDINGKLVGLECVDLRFQPNELKYITLDKKPTSDAHEIKIFLWDEQEQPLAIPKSCLREIIEMPAE